MSFTVTDEQHALRKVVADLTAKRSGHAAAVWREMADMGLLGLLIPEELGGAGAGHVEMGIVMEEMGRALMGGPFLTTAVTAVHLLAEAGDGHESAGVLPRIAAGELIVGIAYAEDSSARLPERVDTAASAIDGDWRLTGQKTFVIEAHNADLLYVLADTDSGAAVFAVERNAPGVTLAVLTTIDQTRQQCRIEFADAPARLVGGLGDGVEIFTAALQRSAVALLSEQAGGAHQAMQMAVKYARTRHQFGRAIGSFQAIKHLCADMLLEAESALSAARFVAASFDDAAPSRFADLALAQAYCSDAFVFVAATNIQVHGGIGFTWEHPAHLYLRRARTDAQLLGEPAWHRERYLRLIGGQA